MEITTLGLDLAKNVFQVHGINSTGEVVVRRASPELRHRHLVKACLDFAAETVGAEVQVRRAAQLGSQAIFDKP